MPAERSPKRRASSSAATSPPTKPVLRKISNREEQKMRKLQEDMRSFPATARDCCDQCRSSKVKCSRGERCERCTKLGYTCTRQQRILRRGPPTKQQMQEFAKRGLAYRTFRPRKDKGDDSPALSASASPALSSTSQASWLPAPSTSAIPLQAYSQPISDVGSESSSSSSSSSLHTMSPPLKASTADNKWDITFFDYSTTDLFADLFPDFSVVGLPDVNACGYQPPQHMLHQPQQQQMLPDMSLPPHSYFAPPGEFPHFQQSLQPAMQYPAVHYPFAPTPPAPSLPSTSATQLPPPIQATGFVAAMPSTTFTPLPAPIMSHTQDQQVRPAARRPKRCMASTSSSTSALPRGLSIPTLPTRHSVSSASGRKPLTPLSASSSASSAFSPSTLLPSPLSPAWTSSNATAASASTSLPGPPDTTDAASGHQALPLPFMEFPSQ